MLLVLVWAWPTLGVVRQEQRPRSGTCPSELRVSGPERGAKTFAKKCHLWVRGRNIDTEGAFPVQAPRRHVTVPRTHFTSGGVSLIYAPSRQQAVPSRPLLLGMTWGLIARAWRLWPELKPRVWHATDWGSQAPLKSGWHVWCLKHRLSSTSTLHCFPSSFSVLHELVLFKSYKQLINNIPRNYLLWQKATSKKRYSNGLCHIASLK